MKESEYSAYIRVNQELRMCVDRLTELKKERSEILIKLREEKPSEELLLRMKQNMRNYELLAKKAETLKLQIKSGVEQPEQE